MTCKSFIIISLFVLSALTTSDPGWAKFTIYSKTDIEIELVIYDGLEESTLLKDSIATETTREVDTSYTGLALLVFTGGQSYPVIIGKAPFTLRITHPNLSPYFPEGSENEFFYTLLSGEVAGSGQYAFSQLMIQAKNLLESSHDVHTVEELAAKKNDFHEFVSEHYDSLKHSDMARRLIAQYFMMHEYVNYHREGDPATEIRAKYQQAILNGVDNWLEILKPTIPGHEILNYIVSLYYNRSMVTLASKVIQKFQDIAYCPADVGSSFSFSDNLYVTNATLSTRKVLGEIKETKIIALVSADCPISMVETVNKARKLIAQHSDVKLIVAPLQELSEKHLAMSKMISDGNLLFIDDQKWREEQLPTPIKLPLFLEIEAE